MPYSSNYNTPPFSFRPIWGHVSGWLIFLLYEQCLIWYTNGSPVPSPTALYFYACNILVFYAQLQILNIGFKVSKPRYLVFTGLLLVVLVLSSILKAIGDYIWVLPLFESERRSMDWGKYIILDLFRSIYFVGAATFLWIAGHTREYRLQAAAAQKLQLISQRDQADAERKYTDAKNALLQQQLNPHLISNTLNFVYNRVFRQSPEAGQCILLLSEIMRYTTGEADPDGKVALRQEVLQIENLVRVNQYRFDHPLQLHIELTGTFSAQRIIPLVLLTLCENLFKHGLLDDPDTPAIFKLELSGQGTLHLYLANRKRNTIKSLVPGGIGLRNLRTRLAHSYPERHELKISDTENDFELTLTMDL